MSIQPFLNKTVQSGHGHSFFNSLMRDPQSPVKSPFMEKEQPFCSSPGSGDITQFYRFQDRSYCPSSINFSNFWSGWLNELLKMPLEISKAITVLTWKGRVERSSTEITPWAVFCGFVLVWVYKCVFLPRLFSHILTVFALGVLIPCCFEGTNVFHGKRRIKCTN